MQLALRRVIALVTVSMMAVLISVLPAVAAASDEAEFVSLMNQTRAASGLAPLESFGDLVDDARRHTADMIARGEIFHSTSAELSNATSGWSKLGENVGMGPNPTILHAAFMASPGHKANILGDFDRVGVGADRAPDGTMFVTVIFMQTAGSTTTTTAPPPTTTTTAPAPTPTTAPPTTVTTPSLTPVTAPAPTPAPASVQSAPVREIPLVAPAPPASTAWIDLAAQAGAYCVVLRVEGGICVE